MAEEYLTDDEQVEAVKRWTVENGPWMIGGIVLGAALLFGWRYYENHLNEQALKAAAQFGDMTAAFEKNDRNLARRIAQAIVNDYSNTPYGDQAELALARLSVDENLLANAVAPLTQVMNTSKDSELRNVARLRLARVLIDQGKPDEALKTLAEGTPGAFAPRYHEVRGDAFYAKKDVGDALNEYRAAYAAGDPNGVDAAVLQLKITDLGGTPATTMPPALAPAAAPASTAPAKAAP
jgi:predicted negative regulator of RcsB-dependent stress response